MGWRDTVAERIVGVEPGRTGYIYVDCPACASRVGKEDRKRKCSVDSAEGWIRCWRCDWRSRLAGFVGDDDEVVYEREDEWEDVAPEFEEPSDYSPLNVGAMRFLRRRGVASSVWPRFDLGYARAGEHRGRIIMPVVVSGGAWVGWVGRYIGKGRRAYHTSAGMPRGDYFYNDRALDEGTGIVVCTEGPIDVLRQAADPELDLVGCLGKPTLTHLARLSACGRPVVFGLDGDAWRESMGYAGAMRSAGRDAWALALPATEDLGSLAPELVGEAVRWAVANRSDADIR